MFFRVDLYSLEKLDPPSPLTFLVWKATTRAMNPTVAQSVIDQAADRDPASAAAEFDCAGMIEQPNGLRMDARQQLEIELRRVQLGVLVPYRALLETLRTPLAAIPVAFVVFTR
jgi:hypothetical protein